MLVALIIYCWACAGMPHIAYYNDPVACTIAAERLEPLLDRTKHDTQCYVFPHISAQQRSVVRR